MFFVQLICIDFEISFVKDKWKYLVQKISHSLNQESMCSISVKTLGTNLPFLFLSFFFSLGFEFYLPRIEFHLIRFFCLYSIDSGWCRLRVRASRGTAIRLRHAEILQNNGMINTANLRSGTCH
jgi:hypothetical protein